MPPSDDRPLRPAGSSRSESAAAAVMLVAIVFPSILQVALRRAPDPPAIQRAAERTDDLKIDLNASNRLELEHLPGVGPKLAERIIASRESRGPFTHPRDVMRVKGIGSKMYEKMKPYLVFPPDDPDAPVAK